MKSTLTVLSLLEDMHPSFQTIFSVMVSVPDHLPLASGKKFFLFPGGGDRKNNTGITEMQENNIFRMTEYLKRNIHPWGGIAAVIAMMKINYLRISFIVILIVYPKQHRFLGCIDNVL